jgi:uncharacterized DUF497 family protein
MVYTKYKEFEWDSDKAFSNFRKHGISFRESLTAFDDPFALISSDVEHSTSDDIREVLIGQSDYGILIVVFTRRPRQRSIRVISARRASRKERQGYEEAKKSGF